MKSVILWLISRYGEEIVKIIIEWILKEVNKKDAQPSRENVRDFVDIRV